MKLEDLTDEQIEKLKNNKIPFGLLDKETQEAFEAISKEDLLRYVMWESTNSVLNASCMDTISTAEYKPEWRQLTNNELWSHVVYRLRPDWEKREAVR
jgi:hypothetical protein